MYPRSPPLQCPVARSFYAIARRAPKESEEARLSNAAHAIRFSVFPLPSVRVPSRPRPARRDFIEQIEAKFAGSCPLACPRIAVYKDCTVSSLICSPLFKRGHIALEIGPGTSSELHTVNTHVSWGGQNTIGESPAIVKRLRVR